MLHAAVVSLAYLLGSIPFGYLLVRLSGGGDVRETGSGGTGATNVTRRAGKGVGVLTLLLDLLKGSAAVLVARALLGAGEGAQWWVCAAGAAAVLGHVFPVWLRFRGGKGVATLLGVIAPLMPVGAAAYALVWVGLLLIVRISSVAGMVAAATAPLSAAMLGKDELFPLTLGFSLLVIWKHRPNIQRLFAGTEPKIGTGAG